jgi:hypothetical protein
MSERPTIHTPQVGTVVEVDELRARAYGQRPDSWLPDVGLGVTLWEGTFEECHGTWLRWCDQDGVVIPTGAERVASERQHAASERQRAERLAERLLELGVDPDRL